VLVKLKVLSWSKKLKAENSKQKNKDNYYPIKTPGNENYWGFFY